MTNSLEIQRHLREAITANAGTFRTTQDWASALELTNPRGQIRLCLEHLCDVGDIQRQITMDWRNAPIVQYGVNTL